jgi:hypothetical protein
MKDLSPAARELVDAHRSDRTLTPADRKRMKHNVMLRVAALGATTATTAVAAKLTAKAAGVSLASKVAVLALSVTALTGVVSVSVRALRARALSNPTASSVYAVTDVVAPALGPAEGPAVAAPATVPGRVPRASRAVVAAPARAASASRKVAVAAPASVVERRAAVTPEVMTAPGSSAAVDSSDGENPTRAATVLVPRDPEPELRALRDARDDLRAGRPASAYRRLDEFDRQGGGGMLAQERSALSAIALCQWQPGPQAQARAAEFLRSSPESPLAIRVRSACAR